MLQNGGSLEQEWIVSAEQFDVPNMKMFGVPNMKMFGSEFETEGTTEVGMNDDSRYQNISTHIEEFTSLLEPKHDQFLNMMDCLDSSSLVDIFDFQGNYKDDSNSSATFI